MDQDASGPKEPSLLVMDLTSDALRLPAISLAKLGRTEQPALVDGVKRGVRKEVQGARDAQVDAMVLEPLAIEGTQVDRDRFCAKLVQQTTHPRLEFGRSLSGDR